MATMLLIPADGGKEFSVKKFGADDWRGMAAAIGAQYIERVRVGPSHALAVDDEGLLTKGKKFNPKASLLYGTYRHGSPIMGDVLFGVEGMSIEGVEWVDKDADELRDQFDALLDAASKDCTGGGN